MLWVLGVAALPIGAMGVGIWRLSRQAGTQGVFGLADRVHRAQSAQDYLLVQRIDQGVIDLGSHEYRAIVRVEPTNFWLLSAAEQDRIQDMWRSFLDAQRDPLTIFALARRVDVRDPLTAWRAPMPRPDGQPSHTLPLSPAMETYHALIADDLTAYVDTVGLLSRTYYLVLHWRPTAKMFSRTADFRSVALKSLNLRQQNVVSQLSRMGLKGVPLSTTESLQLLFDVYNRDRARSMQMKDLAASGVSTLFTTAPRRGYAASEN